MSFGVADHSRWSATRILEGGVPPPESGGFRGTPRKPGFSGKSRKIGKFPENREKSGFSPALGPLLGGSKAGGQKIQDFPENRRFFVISGGPPRPVRGVDFCRPGPVQDDFSRGGRPAHRACRPTNFRSTHRRRRHPPVYDRCKFLCLSQSHLSDEVRDYVSSGQANLLRCALLVS